MRPPPLLPASPRRAGSGIGEVFHPAENTAKPEEDIVTVSRLLLEVDGALLLVDGECNGTLPLVVTRGECVTLPLSKEVLQRRNERREQNALSVVGGDRGGRLPPRVTAPQKDKIYKILQVHN